MIYYSKTTGGFYHLEIHGKNIPPDSVEITDQIYMSLMQGQSNGQTIVADSNGFPINASHPLPTNEQLLVIIKNKAINLLSNSDFATLPDVNLTNKNEWIIYRKSLREIAINPTIDAVFPNKPLEIWS